MGKKCDKYIKLLRYIEYRICFNLRIVGKFEEISCEVNLIGDELG